MSMPMLPLKKMNTIIKMFIIFIHVHTISYMFIQFHHAPRRTSRGVLEPRQSQGPSSMTHDTLNLRRVGNVVGYRHPGYLAFQSIFNQTMLSSFRKLKDPKTVYHVAPLDVLVEPKGSSCYIAAMAKSISTSTTVPLTITRCKRVGIHCHHASRMFLLSTWYA